jgi:spermidine synthase
VGTVWISISLICVIVVLSSLGKLSKVNASRLPKIRLLYAVAIFGLTEISLTILIIFTFQVFYGYVYYKIGLLLALFMVGLAVGSAVLSHYPKSRATLIRALIGFQFILACFSLALALVVFYFHNRPALIHGSFLYQEAFSFMSFAAGLIGGTHFPLANRLLIHDQKQVGRSAGLIYGVDLLGSFLGCLLVGLVLIPLAGILQSLVILALINLSAILPLTIWRMAAGKSDS